MPEQTIQQRLAGVWESHMHDNHGEFVAAVFMTVLRQMRDEGGPGSDFPKRVVETAFEPFENEAEGGFTWALMSNVVSAMAAEFKQYIAERKATQAFGGAR